MLPSGAAGLMATGGCSLAPCTTSLQTGHRSRLGSIVIRPFWHIKHGRRKVGFKLLPRVMAAIPVALWRWSRGRLLIDPASADREVRRIPKKVVGQWRGKLAAKRPRTVLPDRDAPQTTPVATGVGVPSQFDRAAVTFPNLGV